MARGFQQSRGAQVRKKERKDGTAKEKQEARYEKEVSSRPKLTPKQKAMTAGNNLGFFVGALVAVGIFLILRPYLQAAGQSIAPAKVENTSALRAAEALREKGAAMPSQDATAPASRSD